MNKVEIVLALLKMSKMEIQNFQILVSMIYNIASVVKVNYLNSLIMRKYGEILDKLFLK